MPGTLARRQNTWIPVVDGLFTLVVLLDHSFAQCGVGAALHGRHLDRPRARLGFHADLVRLVVHVEEGDDALDLDLVVLGPRSSGAGGGEVLVDRHADDAGLDEVLPAVSGGRGGGGVGVEGLLDVLALGDRCAEQGGLKCLIIMVGFFFLCGHDSMNVDMISLVLRLHGMRMVNRTS